MIQQLLLYKATFTVENGELTQRYLVAQSFKDASNKAYYISQNLKKYITVKKLEELDDIFVVDD